MTPVFEPPPVVSSGLYDNFVLNPVEFTPELPEVDLRDGGIQIGPGAPNLGEATVQVERVKRLIGEGVTGRQLGTVECEIPLLPGIDRYIPQAAAYEPLEAFVGDVQRGKIRWIRHDFKEVGGFAGSLATFVDNASLPKPFGGEVAELTLKLSRHPIWYATTELLAGEASGTDVRHLELELAELLGTAPGLIRLVVTNEGAEDWRGCMVAIECDSFSSAATAKPSYEAKDLTPKGGAEVKTVSGAEVVKCPPLTAGWQTVLSSEIAGVGHMTHVGPRRMQFRLLDPSPEILAGAYLADDVQWKLEWRQNGQAAWVQTMESSTPIVRSSPAPGGYQVIDIGEARPELPLAGDPRFEWRFQGRSLSGSGVQPLIRDVYPMTTEQWQRVADSSDAVTEGEPVAVPALVEDSSGVGTLPWVNPANATKSPASVGTTNATGIPLSKEATSHYLKATKLGFASSIPEEAVPIGIGVSFWVAAEKPGVIFDDRIRLILGGVIKSTGDQARTDPWPGLSGGVRTYGGSHNTFGQTLTRALVVAEEFGIAISVVNKSGSTINTYLGELDMRVYYAELGNQNRVCSATRTLEFTHNGVRRLHATDDVQGELIPEGLDLQAPVPGQGAQPMRALIVPSVGDFDTRPDSAATKLTAEVYYRPAYLSAREAA